MYCFVLAGTYPSCTPLRGRNLHTFTKNMFSTWRNYFGVALVD